MIGAGPAIFERSARRRHGTFLVTSLAMKTWTITVNGEAFLSMAPCGFRRESLRTGLPIEMDIGPGSRHGAGPGLRMNRGVLRHSIMAVGQMSEEEAGA